jgi:hypothetical protein
MSSHNKKSESVFHKTPPTDDRAARTAELLALTLTKDSHLGIADDAGPGGDPYNSTGEHVVSSRRLRRR